MRSQIKKTYLTDAHAHMGTEEEITERIKEQIPTLVCASTPEETGILKKYLELAGAEHVLIPTCGLHPWYADRFSLTDIKPFMKSCALIGEIGMDSVWCETPLKTQRQVFEEQLALACQWRRPVILHTKGQEKEIAAVIRNYSNTYLVHWYSAREGLSAYLEQDCYVSIGPDVWWNQAVQEAASRVPMERLLAETDGMGAVRWAYEQGKGREKRPFPSSVSESLEKTIREIAALRGLEYGYIREQINLNFKRLCSEPVR